MNRFLLFLPLLFLACSIDQPNPDNNTTQSELAWPAWYTPLDTVRVLSWNVEHFVDDFDNPYINNRREDNPPTNMPERRAQLAEVLKLADADIVVFQEFESSTYAKVLADEYFPELGYQVYGGLESDDWYMNVVILSRVPLGTFYSYATSNTPIIGQTNDDGTPAMQTFINNRMWSVDVLVNEEYDFNLTGVHLKAGRGERNEQWRLGMINLMRDQFSKFISLDHDQNLLVVGDFNATPDSDEFNAFLGDSTDLRFIDPLAGTGIFSHPADSVFWRIDHIIPNEFMMPELVNSVQVFTPFSPDSMDFIADHLPMIADIVASD
ncbi:MAG: endonuclease/exonuclease/phosphatase family protein [Balneola sp.]|nr:MAG: endonuclease/exonuclease/phosphatase family protein [Balneola sp.]